MYYCRHDQLIPPAPTPTPSSSPLFLANERRRNCVYMYTPWSTTWSDQKTMTVPSDLNNDFEL
jgi:hypothetical protein